MPFEIIWTRRAHCSLDDAVEYVKRSDSMYADQLRAALLRRVDDLANQPYLGAPADLELAIEYRELLESSYRIFYRVDESKSRVYVTLVWHASRDEPRL